MRGNHVAELIDDFLIRSIPACAGEPPTTSRSSCRCAVYPRLCGGTTVANCTSSLRMGLSPPVRGNLLSLVVVRPRRRSIPACAGEPRLAAIEPSDRRVYPRLCGGTPALSGGLRWQAGLSPPVRGNQGTVYEEGKEAWSIPACAGEP